MVFGKPTFELGSPTSCRSSQLGLEPQFYGEMLEKVSLPYFLFFYPPKQQTTPSTWHLCNLHHPRSQILVNGNLPQFGCLEKSGQATRKKNLHCWIFTTWPFFLVFFCVQTKNVNHCKIQNFLPCFLGIQTNRKKKVKKIGEKKE